MLTVAVPPQQIHVDVVELDKSMVEVASKWFGFESHDHLVTHVGDGIKFVHEASLKGRVTCQYK